MQIDKAGSNDECGRIDLARRRRTAGIGGRNQCGNFAVFDGDIGAEARGAGAVDDGAVSNDEVIFHSGDYIRELGVEAQTRDLAKFTNLAGSCHLGGWGG